MPTLHGLGLGLGVGVVLYVLPVGAYDEEPREAGRAESSAEGRGDPPRSRRRRSTSSRKELGPKYAPAVVFASETGMRRSEWLAIEWRDVDRDAACSRRFGTSGAHARPGRRARRPRSRMHPRAGDGARTHDPQLGKLMLYQLSYAREAFTVAVSRGGGSLSEARKGPLPRIHPGFASSTTTLPWSVLCALGGTTRLPLNSTGGSARLLQIAVFSRAAAKGEECRCCLAVFVVLWRSPPFVWDCLR
jgi:hypothetical protein